MTAAPAPILAPETPAHALGSSDACLWHARPDRLAPETLDACRSVLGPAERERHSRRAPASSFSNRNHAP